MKQEASKKKHRTLLHLSVSFSTDCSTCSNIVIIYPLKRNKYILYIILPFFFFPDFPKVWDSILLHTTQLINHCLLDSYLYNKENVEATTFRFYP